VPGNSIYLTTSLFYDLLTVHQIYLIRILLTRLPFEFYYTTAAYFLKTVNHDRLWQLSKYVYDGCHESLASDALLELYEPPGVLQCSLRIRSICVRSATSSARRRRTERASVSFTRVRLYTLSSLAIHRSSSGCDTARYGGILKDSQFHHSLSRYNTLPLTFTLRSSINMRPVHTSII
jgi:hypothetical protein